MPHKPTAQTRRQVAALVGFGNTDEQIAVVIEISVVELRRRYEKELHPPGRPPHQPDKNTRALVETLSLTETQENIALVLGIDDKTLRKHYREELDLAAIKANAMVARSVYLMASGTGRDAIAAARVWNNFYRGGSDAGQRCAEKQPKASSPAGKKAAAAATAVTAAKGTEWAELLEEPETLN